MANKLPKRALALREIYRVLGVRHEQRWRTEAEDDICRLVSALTFELPVHRIKLLQELLVATATHARGESRTSLAAKCAEGEEGPFRLIE